MFSSFSHDDSLRSVNPFTYPIVRILGWESGYFSTGCWGNSLWDYLWNAGNWERSFSCRNLSDVCVCVCWVGSVHRRGIIGNGNCSTADFADNVGRESTSPALRYQFASLHQAFASALEDSHRLLVDG